MRYVVYGAGGIGAALGAFVWESGRDTTLIARGEHLERIQERGLTLVTPEGSRQVAVPAVGHPSEMEWRGDERVLLTMKAQDTEAALRDLRAAGADPDTTPIFCAQNCIANERIAARYFARVYGVMIVIPGIYLEPGVVHNPITGNHGFMDIGRYPNGVDEEAAQMVETIRAAGYAAQLHENVMASKGAKFRSWRGCGKKRKPACAPPDYRLRTRRRTANAATPTGERMPPPRGWKASSIGAQAGKA
jgi:2-dehydropantoate 2-reductase